jgi:hypothetical protein
VFAWNKNLIFTEPPLTALYNLYIIIIFICIWYHVIFVTVRHREKCDGNFVKVQDPKKTWAHTKKKTRRKRLLFTKFQIRFFLFWWQLIYLIYYARVFFFSYILFDFLYFMYLLKKFSFFFFFWVVSLLLLLNKANKQTSHMVENSIFNGLGN